jgi:hypothetical protein
MDKKMALKDETKKLTGYEGIAELEGSDAEKFLEYDSRDLTDEEEESLSRAEDVSKKYFKF